MEARAGSRSRLPPAPRSASISARRTFLRAAVGDASRGFKSNFKAKTRKVGAARLEADALTGGLARIAASTLFAAKLSALVLSVAYFDVYLDLCQCFDTIAALLNCHDSGTPRGDGRAEPGPSPTSTGCQTLDVMLHI